MVWGKAGSTTLSSAGDTIDSGTITASKCNQSMIHTISSSSTNYNLQFNSDTDSNYSYRASYNGGSDASRTSQSKCLGNEGSAVTTTAFHVSYVANISDEEKLSISHTVRQETAGAGTAPNRQETVGKYIPSPDATITNVQFTNSDSGSFDTGSNVSVLGSDLTPAAAVPAPDNVQDNSIFVETDTARRYWFDFTSDVTHSSLTNISASGNLLYSARRYGCKLTSGNTAIGQSVTSLAFNIQDSSYPSGESFYYKVYRSDDGSGDANTSWTQVATTGAISESELPASYDWLEKSFTTPVTLALNDVVCIEAANVGSSSAYISLSYNSSTSDISTANVKGAFRNSGVSDQFSTTTSGTEATVFKIIGTTATWTRGYFNARGVFGSGYIGSGNVNVVDYITIPTLGDATDFGDLSVSRRALGSVANDTRGVFGGGYGASSSVDTIDYITIASLGNATDFGNLTTSNRAGVVGAGSDTRGLFAGGESSYSNVIDYVTIATLGNATDFGNLTVARKQGGATSDKTTAVFMGGEGGQTTMDYVTISTPANAVSFGTFTQGSYGGHCGTISNGTRGIFAIGGSTATGGYSNVITYITIATPSNSTDFGDLSQGRSDGGQVGDSTRGVFGGGKYTSGSSNGVTTIDYITIGATTIPVGTATTFGNLTSARYATTGLSDGQ